jgi:hypothetical protein
VQREVFGFALRLRHRGMNTPPDFEKTEQFKHFKKVMTRLVDVPKAELDEQVRLHDKSHARILNGPGQSQSPLSGARHDDQIVPDREQIDDSAGCLVPR